MAVLSCDCCPNEARYVERVSHELFCGLHASATAVRFTEDEDLESIVMVLEREVAEYASEMAERTRRNIAEVMAETHDREAS